MLQYRAATCHYRLASLHHDTYRLGFFKKGFIYVHLIKRLSLNRNGEGESIINGRNVRTLAEQHYTNANIFFNQLEHWDEVIRLQLEKAGIYEFQLKRTVFAFPLSFLSYIILQFAFSGLTGAISKVRILQSILSCYLATKEALFGLTQPNNGAIPILEIKTNECMALMCSKLQSTLLHLNKLSRSVKKS